ncbi:MAG: glycosyltransferase, partial [Chlamydiia bacterium]|nr:glycosyltransferase [Chlamydiia bacterium]
MLFSVIIPVRKCPLPLLGSTLESILNQKDVQFEVVVVDASNCQQTQDFIHRYENLQVLDTEQQALDAIIQCGTDAAHGDYVNILLPGEFYLSQYALQTVQEFIEQNDAPDIIQCGWMQQGKACFEMRIPWLIKKGFYPITLQNYWFKNEIFEKVGSFDTTFQFRGKFDLFCRLNQSGAKWTSFKR